MNILLTGGSSLFPGMKERVYVSKDDALEIFQVGIRFGRLLFVEIVPIAGKRLQILIQAFLAWDI